MTPAQKEACGQILNHFGPKPQTEKTLEELSGLHTAIREQSPAEVIEEIADVKIMLEQMVQMLGCQQEVERIISDKITRTQSRIVTGFYNEAVAGA